jgi:hypothetical protein
LDEEFNSDSDDDEKKDALEKEKTLLKIAQKKMEVAHAADKERKA